MGDKQQAIFRTLLYSDLFNCPLSEDELFYYLNYRISLPRKDIKEIAPQTPGVFEYDRWYSLRNDWKFITERKKRQRISEKKMTIARRVVMWLSWIPSISFIGVSGSVAAGNADRDEDIDFFVITRENTLYATRFVILLFLEILGKRRKRYETQVSNKICLNMLIDEVSLVTPSRKQSLYTAREIAQLVPLFDHHNTYKRFVKANAWSKTYLPNIGRGEPHLPQLKTSLPFIWLFRLLEPVMRFIELRYMKRHQTVEKITPHYLAFHPGDTSLGILHQYEKLLRQYNNNYIRR